MPLHTAVRDAVELVATAVAGGRPMLSEPEAKSLLRVLGIPVPPGSMIKRAEDAAAAAAAVGVPVAVKAVASALSHKTDVGGVICPVHAPVDAVAACDQIAQSVRRHRPDVLLEGFFIEAYCPSVPEWILAARVDPKFGPTIMFGLGGIYTEILHQISFRLAPVTDQDIESLLRDVPATRILDSARGRPPADGTALKQAIRRLSDFVARPEIASAISEIEINPLTVDQRGVMALDAVVVFSQ